MPILKAKTRKILGKKVKRLRKENFIPAIVYGHKITPQTIEIDKLLFKKTFEETGESGLIDLIVDNKPLVKVLVHDIQYDPLTEEISHIDFYQIKEKEKVTVEVGLKFIGESLAVKEKGGTLVHHLTKIKIECLPKDLIHEIEVDVSSLRELNNLIRIKNLQIPPEIKIVHEPEDVVASVSALKVEEEVKVEEVAKVEEVVEEKKEEIKKVEGTPASKVTEEQKLKT